MAESQDSVWSHIWKEIHHRTFLTFFCAGLLRILGPVLLLFETQMWQLCTLIFLKDLQHLGCSTELISLLSEKNIRGIVFFSENFSLLTNQSKPFWVLVIGKQLSKKEKLFFLKSWQKDCGLWVYYEKSIQMCSAVKHKLFKPLIFHWKIALSVNSQEALLEQKVFVLLSPFLNNLTHMKRKVHGLMIPVSALSSLRLPFAVTLNELVCCKFNMSLCLLLRWR